MASRASAFKKVRNKKRFHEEWQVWTLELKIYVKTDPASTTIIEIQSLKVFEKL